MFLEVVMIIVLTLLCLMADGFDLFFNNGKCIWLSILGSCSQAVLDTLFILLMLFTVEYMSKEKSPFPPVAEKGIQTQEEEEEMGLPQIKGYLHL